jgi:uncharacterized protein (TIGR02001 family)
MKKLLVCMVALLAASAGVHAAEQAAPQDMGVTVDVTYVSKYIWRGFDLYDDKGAVQPSVSVDLGGGFSATTWMSYAGASGAVDGTEYNYILAYDGSVLEDSVWKTNYSFGYTYFDFIDTSSKDADTMEVFLTGSMPALTGCGVVPHFAVFQGWTAKSGGANNDYGGTIYLVGFGYDFMLDEAPELPMSFSWDIVYNDGTGGSTVDHDWSHMVWGLSTSMTCPATGGTLAPGVYFQNSFDDSVNNEDELWAGISYSFSF